MPLFICRWQNGDFSAVSAATKTDAIALLDEVGNAEVYELFAVKNFMVHFSLKQQTDEVDDFVPVEMEGVGEETVDILSGCIQLTSRPRSPRARIGRNKKRILRRRRKPRSVASMKPSSRSAPGNGVQRSRRFQTTRRRLTSRS
jgi:hypothetical protein